MGNPHHDAQLLRMRKPKSIPKKERRRTFIKAWRKHRDKMTQAQLVDRLDALGVEMSDAQLSRIENGHQEYRQDQLEAIAEALRCTPADLLMRDPTAADPIWSIWDTLDPRQRYQAVELIKTLKRTGTEG